MKTGFKAIAFALVATMCVAGAATAQSWDVDGPNAALTLQGQTPSVTDAINHDVTVLVPGNLVMSITSGANPQAPVILLASSIQPGPMQGFAAVPWGGSIDVGVFNPGTGLPGGVEVMLDGNNPTRIPDFFSATDDGIPGIGVEPEFILAYSAGTNLDGVAFSFQGIVLDPSVPGFGLDNTEAVDANFVQGTNILAGTGDDGTVEVPFSFGNTFEFHGVSYTSLWPVGNGYMSFGATTTVISSGFTQDFVSWLNAEPSIAPAQADWGPGAGAGAPAGAAGNTGVLLTQTGNMLNVVWGDPSVGQVSHFADADLNTFGASLVLQDGVDVNQGNFSINWPVLDQLAVTDFGNGLAGHTPGGVALAGATVAETDLNNIDGAGVIGAANGAQFEEHNLDGTVATLNGGDGLGTARSYNNFTLNKNGRGIDFIALTSLIGGDGGYFAQGNGSQPDDAQGFVGSDSFSDAGGDTGVLAGVFLNFDPALGSITFDPAGLAIPAIVIGVYDDTASAAVPIPNPDTVTFRNGQGLEFVTSPMAGLAGPVDVLVDFGNGSTFTLSATVQSAGTVFTSYTLADDQAQLHTLAPTNAISWYGTSFADININSNGSLTFGVGTNAFQDTVADMFAGFLSGGIAPGIAPIWCDLNQTLGGTTDVFENTVTGEVTVTYNGVFEFGGAASLGSWATTFNTFGPNSAVVDYTGMAGAAALLTGGSTIGVTNGDNLTGSNTDLSDTLGTGISLAVTAAGGTYQSSVNSPGVVLPDSIGEAVPGGFDHSTYGTRTWLDAAGTGDWTLF